MASGQNVKLGQGQVGYYDEQGNAIVVMGNLGNSQTGIKIQDDNGNQVALLGKDSDGSIKVSFNGQNQTVLAFGQQKDGTLGLSSTDATGFILFKTDGETWFWYDKNNNTNVMQVGLLPDGSYGWAVAVEGHNVSEGF